MRVHFATSKIYGKKKIFEPAMLCDQALPRVTKIYQDEQDAFTHEEELGQVVVDKAVYSFPEYYMSMFQFDKEELEEHMQRNDGSIEGLNAKVYADWFVADFDDKENGIKGVMPNVSKALAWFEANNIPYWLYASGKKGVHLYVPIQVFKFDQRYADRMHIVFSSIADWFEETFKWEHGFIDRLYNPVRMIRFPFSMHPDTGLLKTICIFHKDKYTPSAEVRDYLTVEESVTTKVAQLLRKQTLLPYPNVVPKQIEINIVEKPVYENSPADIVNRAFLTPKSERLCIYSMLNATNIEGHRHKAALCIIFWLKEKGYPEEMAFQIMQYWSNKLVKPFTHTELLDIMRYYGRYTLNCQHEDMKRYCPMNNTCVYWKNEVLAQRVASFEDTIEGTKELASETTATRFYFNEVIADMKGYTSWKFGFIGGIAAAPEVGKTWFALNIATKIRRFNFLIFSYEQSKYELMLRMANLHGLDINNPDDCEELKDRMKNIFIDDSGVTTLDEQMQIKAAIEDQHGIKIHFIMTDYVQLIPVEDYNVPGKLITQPTQQMVEISKRLKTRTKREQFGYIFLSQVPKEAAGNGTFVLYAEDMKDSMALQAMCDWVFTMWRPNRDVRGKVDNIIGLFLCKHKHITDSHQRSYYYFENGKILEPIYEPVSENERDRRI